MANKKNSKDDDPYLKRARAAVGQLKADDMVAHSRALPLVHQYVSPSFPLRDLTGLIPAARGSDWFSRVPQVSVVGPARGAVSPITGNARLFSDSLDLNPGDPGSWDHGLQGVYRPIYRAVRPHLPVSNYAVNEYLFGALVDARRAAAPAAAAPAAAAPAAAAPAAAVRTGRPVSRAPGLERQWLPTRGQFWSKTVDGLRVAKDAVGAGYAWLHYKLHPSAAKAALEAAQSSDAVRLQDVADAYQKALKGNESARVAAEKAFKATRGSAAKKESAAYEAARQAIRASRLPTGASAKATTAARTSVAGAAARTLRRGKKLARAVTSTSFAKYTPQGMAGSFALGRWVDAAINGLEFVSDFDAVYSGGKNDYIKTYNGKGKPVRVAINNVGMVAPSGSVWWEDVKRSAYNILGDLSPFGAVSYDDGLLFNIKDAIDATESSARAEFEDYFRDRAELSRRLMNGLNPATGEPLRAEVLDSNGEPTGKEEDLSDAWMSRDQRLSDALQQRYLESVFFRSFDPKWADENKSQVEEVYRQIAGGGRSKITASYLTPNLMPSPGGLDVSYSEKAGLMDRNGELVMPGANPQIDGPRPFNPADVDAQRFHALVMYERKRYADAMQKVSNNVADWDNFIANAPASIRNNYADRTPFGLNERHSVYPADQYRAAAEENLLREHEKRMDALAMSPAAQRLATANTMLLYRLATGHDFANDYYSTRGVYDPSIHQGVSEDNYYGAPMFAKEYLEPAKDGKGWVAKPGSQLWTLSNEELEEKARNARARYGLSLEEVLQP